MTAKIRRKREHTAYARNVDNTPHARHGRECDDAAPSRERIARPFDATPRRAEDWR